MTPTQDNPGPGLPARRRRTLSTLLHRLLLTLAVGAGVLVYNAFSIVNGDGGLVAVPMFSGGTVAGPVAAPHG